VRRAAGAALDRDEAVDAVARDAVSLAGERIFEHLRSLHGAGDLPRTEDDPSALHALRAALLSARAVAVGGAIAAAAAPDARRVAGGAPERLVSALDQLGLLDPPVLAPAAVLSPDCLTADDDIAVVEALRRDEAFAGAPRLPGRCPQTGPAARTGTDAFLPDAFAAARRAEIARAATLIAHGGSEGDDGTVRAGRVAPDAGWAAVESPRGRLHYLIRLDAGGGLAAARVVAPTEWNFHAEGPLATRLPGTDAGPDPVATLRRRALGFDPCVAVEVTVREAVDA
jgi:hypothetical protein